MEQKCPESRDFTLCTILGAFPVMMVPNYKTQLLGKLCANNPAHRMGNIWGRRLPHLTAPARAAVAVPGEAALSSTQGCRTPRRARHMTPCPCARLLTLQNGGICANTSGVPGWCWHSRCRLSQSRGGKVKVAAGQLLKSQRPYR